MNSILYETDEQRKHVHTGWSKVVAVDEVYWKCNHCGVTADSPVAPADDPKVAEEGSSTNDRANAEVSRKLAQEAQSEAPPEGAIYLATVTQTRERDGQWVDGNYSWKECWYVWHYFLVEESEESE